MNWLLTVSACIVACATVHFVENMYDIYRQHKKSRS